MPRVQVREERRADQVGAAGQHPAGDHRVRARRQLVHDPLGVLQRIGEVAIGEQHERPPRQPQPGAGRKPLASVRGEADAPDGVARVSGGEGLYEARSAVARGVVHDDQLPGLGPLAQPVVHPVQGGRDEVLGVVHGKDERRARNVAAGQTHVPSSDGAGSSRTTERQGLSRSGSTARPALDLSFCRSRVSTIHRPPGAAVTRRRSS